MNESMSLSFYLGRWHGVPIRVHSLFVAVAAFIFFLAMAPGGSEPVTSALSAVVILFLSVFAHELAHAVAVARFGGVCESLVIGPLGGLGTIDPPRDRQAELVTALAGPATNLALALVAIPLLLAAQVSLTPLASVLAPGELLTGEWWVVALKLTFWINGTLLIVNLLPAYPLDGARLMRSLVSSSLDYRSAGYVLVRVSKLSALALCLLAWLERDALLAGVLPTWLPLLMLATWVYCAAQQEAARLDDGDWDEDLSNYDFSQGYTSLERTFDAPRRPGTSVRRWLQQRSEMRRRKRIAREQDEERQVDDILVRLHERGMNGLSAKERALLNRVSERLRNRLRQ
jgi:Zn-dependent protease